MAVNTMLECLLPILVVDDNECNGMAIDDIVLDDDWLDERMRP